MNVGSLRLRLLAGMLAWMLLMEVPTTSCGEAKSPASPRSWNTAPACAASGMQHSSRLQRMRVIMMTSLLRSVGYCPP